MRIAWALVLAGCASEPGIPQRFEVLLSDARSVGEVLLYPDGSEHVRIEGQEGTRGVTVDARLVGGSYDAQVTWGADRTSYHLDPGWTWWRRKGLEVQRSSGKDARILWAGSSTPMVSTWRTDPLLWTAMLGDLPRNPGEERELSVLDVNAGRPDRLWVSARERVGEGTRLFAHTASGGQTVWIGEDRVLSVDDGALQIRAEGFVPPRKEVAPLDLAQTLLSIERDDVRLVGVLDRPRGITGPLPVVVMIHGSGPIDRDGNAAFLHMGTFRVLAQALADAGFAALRWDKRGVGDSVWKTEDHPMTLEILAADVEAWLDVLAERDDVGPVFLLGHSEGGILAPLVASRRSEVMGVVMLAGPVDGLGDLLRDQLRLLYVAHGLPEAEIAAAARGQDALLTVLATGRDRDVDLPGFQGASATWLRSHLQHDPRPTLAGLKMPVLALYGDQDLQVPIGEADKARQALEGHPDSRVEVLEGMDHLLMPIEHVPGMGAYADPDRRMDPRLPARLVEWVGERVAEGAAAE